MIPNREGWIYLALKKTVCIINRNNKDAYYYHNEGAYYYYLKCLHSFRTRNKLESHKKVWTKKNCCNIVMSSETLHQNIGV